VAALHQNAVICARLRLIAEHPRPNQNGGSVRASAMDGSYTT